MKSGAEILRELHENSEISTSIIAFTGNSDISTIIEVMRLGADNYIQKPFELEELKITVEKGIQLRKIRMKNINYENCFEQEVEKKKVEIKKAYMDIVNSFAGSIEMRDLYTWGHSNRVSKIAYMNGKEMGLDDKKLEEIKIGSILRDIGKIGIADNILKKPGKLTDEEFKEIKKHPQIGNNIIKNISSLKPVIPYILYHHERYDGTGYPEGLERKHIPIEGRILAVADAFEAMISDRPYRKALPLDVVYNEIIVNSGKQFDPDIVNIFIKSW